MKIKWVYIFLSILTVSLLTGVSLYVFNDGAQSIELQRTKGEDLFNENSIFIDFVASYKSLVHSDYVNGAALQREVNQYEKSLERLRNLNQTSHDFNIKELEGLGVDIKVFANELSKLAKDKSSHNEKKEQHWRKIQKLLVGLAHSKMKGSEEFLPGFKGLLDSWSENISILQKLKSSIDVSYIDKKQFDELQSLIHFSNWFMSFNSKLSPSANFQREIDLTLNKINALTIEENAKRDLSDAVRMYFTECEKVFFIQKQITTFNRNVDEFRDVSTKKFENKIFPNWQSLMTGQNDSQISQRYKRLKNVVTTISLSGAVIILSMLIIFLKIFPHLHKMELKAKEVAQGNYEAKFTGPIPKTEIGQVMTAFNEMSYQISKYINQLERKESEKLQLSESIQKANRLAQLGEFSAKMAHELKNPLSILNFCLNDAAEYLESNQPQYAKEEIQKSRQALERIKITATRLGSKNHYSTKEVFDLQELLDEIEKMYKSLLLKENIKLNLIKGPEDLLVKAPRVELTGAIANLIDNAIECIRSNSESKSQLKLELLKEDDIIFQISNSGAPIEEKEKIFDSFYSTKSGSTRGLGLTIVKDVVQECHGSISYSYDTDESLNIFTLTLPIASPHY